MLHSLKATGECFASVVFKQQAKPQMWLLTMRFLLDMRAIFRRLCVCPTRVGVGVVG